MVTTSAGVIVLACINSPDLFFKPFASLGLLTCMLPMSTSEKHAERACVSMTALPVLRRLLNGESVSCLQPSVLRCQVLCHQTSHWHGSIQLVVDPPVVHTRIPVGKAGKAK